MPPGNWGSVQAMNREKDISEVENHTSEYVHIPKERFWAIPKFGLAAVLTYLLFLVVLDGWKFFKLGTETSEPHGMFLLPYFLMLGISGMFSILYLRKIFLVTDVKKRAAVAFAAASAVAFAAASAAFAAASAAVAFAAASAVAFAAASAVVCESYSEEDTW
jgi:hypothetical protein